MEAAWVRDLQLRESRWQADENRPCRYQFADGFATLGYAFAMTTVILLVLEPAAYFMRKRERSIFGEGGEETMVEDRNTIIELMPPERAE